MAPPRLLMVDLVTAVYWIDDALQSGLRARGWPPLTRMQSLILVNVAGGVQRGSALARNLGVTRQAMSQTLAEMEARGLVKLIPDPQDRRAQLVTFETESSAIRYDAVAILETIDAILTSRIGAKRAEALREAAAYDWGPSPVEAVAIASGATPPAPKRRGRPPGSRKTPADT